MLRKTWWLLPVGRSQLFFGAVPVFERENLSLLLRPSLGSEILLEVQSPWESWKLFHFVILKLFPCILPFVWPFVCRTLSPAVMWSCMRRGNYQEMSSYESVLFQHRFSRTQNVGAIARVMHLLPPTFLICWLLRRYRVAAGVQRGTSLLWFVSGSLTDLLC